jgi:alpha-tubulin suppressor-like RCC1 family protein
VETLRGNKVEAIACGAAHTVAVVTLVQFNSRLVYTWGSNTCGQLGQGKSKKLLQPTAVAKMSKQSVQDVSCGALHTVLRTENGEVWTAGSNKYGQLGHGTTVYVLDSFAFASSPPHSGSLFSLFLSLVACLNQRFGRIQVC